MDGPLKKQSYAFAIRVVRLSQYLQDKKKEYVLSKQILRSGTAVGALIREAESAHRSWPIQLVHRIVRGELHWKWNYHHSKPWLYNNIHCLCTISKSQKGY